MRIMTKTAKKRAIRRVHSLINDNGLSLSKARLKVAKEHGLRSGSTVYNWERTLHGKAITAPHVQTKTVTTLTNGTVNVTEVQVKNSQNETLTFRKNDVNMLKDVLSTLKMSNSL